VPPQQSFNVQWQVPGRERSRERESERARERERKKEKEKERERERVIRDDGARGQENSIKL